MDLIAAKIFRMRPYQTEPEHKHIAVGESSFGRKYFASWESGCFSPQTHHWF
jgi:hypothetical protein